MRWENHNGLIGCLGGEDEPWAHVATVFADDDLNHGRRRPFPTGTGAAHAHMIAAAKEMLAALELARDRVLHIDYTEGSHVRMTVDAAIAKAKGETDE